MGKKLALTIVAILILGMICFYFVFVYTKVEVLSIQEISIVDYRQYNIIDWHELKKAYGLSEEQLHEYQNTNRLKEVRFKVDIKNCSFRRIGPLGLGFEPESLRENNLVVGDKIDIGRIDMLYLAINEQTGSKDPFASFLIDSGNLSDEEIRLSLSSIKIVIYEKDKKISLEKAFVMNNG